jgi:flagellar protein FlgJ
MTTPLRTDSLLNLRSLAAKDPKLAIRETARQFESLFTQELMKSMRQATVNSGLLDNDGTHLGTEMLDTEFAGKMAGMKGGLSDAIARQLERQMGLVTQAAPPSSAAPSVNTVAQRTPLRAPASASEFVARHTEAARAAEAATGIPATFMVAQAAHETGWGRKEIRMADGSNSFNLFGIKAGADWKGPVARVTTTEVAGGQPRKVVQAFRAYSSYEASFADYARLMKTNPRYQSVVNDATAHAADPRRFARGLQNAGYATDPAYGDKLARVINTTLRLQRSLA